MIAERGPSHTPDKPRRDADCAQRHAGWGDHPAPFRLAGRLRDIYEHGGVSGIQSFRHG